jgi:hypothetical protein
MSDYNLTCLLCGLHVGEIIERDSPKSDLVRMQEHAMDNHDVNQDQLRLSSKEELVDGFVWHLPDGRPWLRASVV